MYKRRQKRRQKNPVNGIHCSLGLKGISKRRMLVASSFFNARMRQYVWYYFRKRLVNLAKFKKAELKVILSPLLENNYATAKISMDLVTDISIGDRTSYQSGIDYGEQVTMADACSD